MLDTAGPGHSLQGSCACPAPRCRQLSSIDAITLENQPASLSGQEGAGTAGWAVLGSMELP